MNKRMEVNSLLFHASHGVCRVTSMMKQDKSDDFDYVLVPTHGSSGKVRFSIPQQALETSGFSPLISEVEAIDILSYLKTGKKENIKSAAAWQRAILILEESASTMLIRDGRKRQQIEIAVKGLVGEIAHVFSITRRNAGVRVKESLNSIREINSVVLNSLKKVQNA